MFANTFGNWYVPKWVHQVEFYANKKRKRQTNSEVWNGCQTEEEVADVAVGAGIGAVCEQNAEGDGDGERETNCVQHEQQRARQGIGDHCGNLRATFGVGEVVLAEVSLDKVAKPREVIAKYILVQAKFSSQRTNFFRCTKRQQKLGGVAWQ